MKQNNDHALLLKNVKLYLHDACLFALPDHVRVGRGEVLTIMGPSGVGKSSLISWISGHLQSPLTAEGSLMLNGQALNDIPPHKRKIGVIFQDDLLFPHLSVAENLALGIDKSISKEKKKNMINNALSEVGLDGYENRDPATLSGGQRARIAVMRTLLSAPNALLMDEAFNGLDETNRQNFRHFVFEHGKKNDLPMLLVTHDMEDAKSAGGEIIHLQSPIT